MSTPYELVLDGPNKNALNLALLRSILARLDEHEGRALLLRGELGTFSAGVDLKEVLSLDEAGMREFLGLLDVVCGRLFHWTAPTVALIEGHAIAGGCVLALACDVRVAHAAPETRVGLTEVAVGVMFPPAVWKLVTHRIPPHSRDQVLLGAALHTPRRAKELGLVDEVVDEAGPRARSLIRTMARYDPAVFARTKAMLHAGVMDVDEAETARFLDEVAPAWTSPELRARLSAFLSGGRR
jgi:enoyl-CoA hydratase